MMGWEKNSEVREVDELLWEHSEKYFLGIFYIHSKVKTMSRFYSEVEFNLNMNCACVPSLDILEEIMIQNGDIQMLVSRHIY